VDPVRHIQDYNAGRDPERLLLKYRAMRAGASAFLRGTCHLFYARLARAGGLKSAPPVWVCGDLHLENFGSYKGDNRLVYFDLNDFDEAALAPALWELVRLLTSLRVGGNGLALDEREVQSLCQRCVQFYASSLALGKAYWIERDTASGLVRELLDGLRDRPRAAFLDARTTAKRGRRTLITNGKKALPASASQQEAVRAFMQAFAKGQPDPDFFSVLDVARRVAGTGSLGVDRFVILVQGKGSPDRNYLLDLKQALPSSLAPHLKLAQPAWRTQAERVVAVQRRMQAVPMAFLHPVVFNDRAYVLRALQPSEDRVALSGKRRNAVDRDQLVATLGRLVAWAQLRSACRDGAAGADELIDFGRRKKWQDQLLSASRDCAAQVTQDAAAYDQAFDDGAFRI
jgi:uncharacterized protein (DUF2252 family)